jgi:hypothetical protein
MITTLQQSQVGNVQFLHFDGHFGGLASEHNGEDSWFWRMIASGVQFADNLTLLRRR